MSTATDPLADVLGVAAQVRVLEEALAGLGPELVPERVAKQDLAGVVRSLGRIERCAAGARLVLTKAAAEVGAWRAQGFRSPAEWAARTNGTTVGQAAADLEASEQLEGLPATRDAVGAGELSPDAAKAVAAGATADRSTEQGLLAKGRAGDLTGARNDARRARQRADERDGRAAERMHRRRQLRTWVEVDGEGRGQWNVPPAYQATFLAALEPYRKEAYRRSRAAGQPASAEALMADALQLLCLDVLADLDLPVPDDARTGEQGRAHGGGHVASDDRDDDITDTDGSPTLVGTEPGTPPARPEPPAAPAGGGTPSGTARPGKPPRYRRRAPAQISFHVDVAAWLRGHTEGEEVCEVPGMGPVPVSLAQAFQNDATLKLIVRHGHDITTITSHRRYIPAALRTALEARDRECVVPGCHVTRGLQVDHIRDFARGGPTEAANNALICTYHHHLKTHCHWTLRGPPGHWTFTPPDTS